MAEATKLIEATTAQGMEPADFARCQDDPSFFTDRFLVIDDAQGDASGTMPFKLWPAQSDLITDMDRERLLLILKARQLGISWLACAYALWLCLFRPGRMVLAFSKGQDEANELTRRVTVMFDRLPLELKTLLPTVTKSNTEEIAWSNGSRFKSMPASPSAGRTFTASLVIMDETAFMQWAKTLYTALRPTIDGGGKLIVLSTANGKSNLFYTLCERAMSGGGRLTFRFLPWWSRPGRDAAWYESVRADAIDDASMQQEYPGTPDEAFESTEVSTFLGSMTLWDACYDPSIKELDAHTPCVLALDAGESNDSFGAIIVSRHPTDPELIAVRMVRSYVPTTGIPLDFDLIETDIRRWCKQYAIQEISYDPMLLGQMIRRLKTDYPTKKAVPVECRPFPQGTDRLIADKGLLDLITARRVAYGSDPNFIHLRSHISNANKKVDVEGRQLRIVKREHRLKIDLAVTLAMACDRLPRLVKKTIKSFPGSIERTSPWVQSA